MPYEEICHTADWSIRVQAGDLPALFGESALGMNRIAEIALSKSPRLKRTFDAVSPEPETLLVSFLSELVFQVDHEHTAFDRFDITLADNHLHVEMSGASIQSMAKAIKAVTYHNLAIDRTEDGYSVEIVFDV